MGIRAISPLTVTAAGDKRTLKELFNKIYAISLSHVTSPVCHRLHSYESNLNFRRDNEANLEIIRVGL